MVIETRETVRYETLSPEPTPVYRLVFGQQYLTKIHEGHESRIDLPLSGKTYRVALRDQKAIITDDQGGHVPRDEGKALARRFVGYAARKEALARFANRPMKIGERSEGLESMLRADFTRGVEVVNVGDVTATLTEAREIDGVTCGGFDVSVHVVLRTEDGGTLVNDMSGKFYVRTTDASFARVDLSGPVQVSETIHGLDIQAEGHAVLHSAHAYR